MLPKLSSDLIFSTCSMNLNKVLLWLGAKSAGYFRLIALKMQEKKNANVNMYLLDES